MEGNPALRAEVIAIGDELTSGARLDTNSQWLSQQLGDLGIQTAFHTTVGDDLADHIDVLRTAARRVQLVVCSGGLGPTQDDLTRQAMAAAFNRELILDEASLETIRAMFSNRRRAMPERNRIQAMFPAGSQVIPNPHGSAPGIDLTISETPSGTCRLLALPGVPAEMKQMWLETVVPRLEAVLHHAAGPVRSRLVKLFGIGESDVEVKLPELIERGRRPTVGITVSRATISLRITGRAKDEAAFEQLIAPTLAEINSALGHLIFGQGDIELEHAVQQLLLQRRQSLACVEIGAASWISDWMLAAHDPLQATDGAFAGGIAFPSLAAAVRWLAEARASREQDAPQDAANSGDAIWQHLARQTRDRFGASLGLAVGVYPSRREMESGPAAFEFVFACAEQDQVHIERRSMGGHPDVLGPRVAKTGLDIVRRLLAKPGAQVS